MKWNTEWVDLQIVGHMVAECWRMNGHQLEKYVQKLSMQQELIFAGDLGLKFLELLRKSIDNGTALDWPKLQKDIHLMQELIRDGQAQHDAYWKSQYQELTADMKAYFGTEFGRAFTEQIAAKLELGISEGQRMLRHDISKIQKICSSCDWDDDEKARKAVLLLTQDEKYYFSSWLGDAFINVLQERYGKKEEEESPGLRMQPEAPVVRKPSFKGKAACVLFLCILAGLLGLFLYAQSDGGRGGRKLRNLLSEVKSAIDIGRLGTWNGQAEKKASGQGGDSTLGQAEGKALDQGEGLARGSAEGLALDQGEGLMPDPAEGMASGQSDRSMPDSAGGMASGQSDRSASDPAEGKMVNSAKGPMQNQDGKAVSGQGEGLALHQGENRLAGQEADTGTGSDKAVALLDILPKYQSFHQEYPDLFGWLRIPGTKIDHPVMQSDGKKGEERYYYLHRDYTGKASEAGSLFVEDASSCFPQDKNTVIYGHNMSNGHNFGMLEAYKDPDFFQEHPAIEYDTIYEEGTYQIVAVLVTRILYQEEEGFRYYRFYNYHSKPEFQECVDFIKENQLYETDGQLQYGDQLLMLSTCEYSQPNGRLVVVAKKVG